MNGEDAHFSYDKEQVYPGDNFDYHLIPFEAVRRQKEDLPYDSENPLFPFGYGLTYR